MRNSLYVKSIIFFILILIVSNTLMIIVFISTINNILSISNEEYIKDSADTARKLQELELSRSDIVSTVSNDRVRIKFYDNYNSIEERFKEAIFEKQRAEIEKGGEVIIRSQDIFMLIKTDGGYCIIYPIQKEGPLTLQMAIIAAAFITVCVAVFLIFLGVGTFIKPLINMSEAARKITEGDYSVRLEPRENKDAIGQLVDDFNEMCRKLSETEMLRNDFISSISHEFKTPIQSIYGFANLLQEETEDPTHKEYLKRIREEAERLSTLSANILQLNKLDHIIDLGIDNYSLDEQIRQSILMLEDKWSAKKITFNIEMDKVKIMAKEDMMKQVFINLLDNAIKFAPLKGRIDVILNKEKDRIKVIIHDNGKGISKEEEERIFEKFYKGDPSRNTSGNGLGLPLIKKILDLHNFKISVTNSKTGGAEFTITIPLH